MKLKLIMMLILASLTLLFAAQNFAVVDVGLLFWSASMPSALLIFLTLIIGFTLGWSLHSYLSYRKSKDVYVYL